MSRQERGMVLSIEHPDFVTEANGAARDLFLKGMAAGWEEAWANAGIECPPLRILSGDGASPQLYFSYLKGGVEQAEREVAFVILSVTMGALSHMMPVVAYSFGIIRDVPCEDGKVWDHPLTSLA